MTCSQPSMSFQVSMALKSECSAGTAAIDHLVAFTHGVVENTCHPTLASFARIRRRSEPRISAQSSHRCDSLCTSPWFCRSRRNKAQRTARRYCREGLLNALAVDGEFFSRRRRAIM